MTEGRGLKRIWSWPTWMEAASFVGDSTTPGAEGKLAADVSRVSRIALPEVKSFGEKPLLPVRKAKMGEFEEIMKTGIDALSEGETFALTTVVRVRGSAPRHSGARMLVWRDGKTKGTIGGATFEQRAIADAMDALKDGKSRYETYLFSTRPEDKQESVGLCGGEVDVYIEVIRPDPTLMIIGAGHIAIPLARMADLLDMRIVVVDDRPDYANKERFPEANEIFLLQYDEQAEELSSIEASIDPSTYVVVATWGYDKPALAQILKKDPAYVALVASPVKARTIFEGLRSEGMPDEKLAEVRTPAGLDIGAETPAEIALSILAEILTFSRSRTGRPLSELTCEFS